MQVTISGQMMICMLAEWLLLVGGLRIIQCNTDGITLWVRRVDLDSVKNLCREWEKLTGLVLEDVEYRKMVIADVNSYLAQKTDGSVKLKGRYDITVCLNVPHPVALSLDQHTPPTQSSFS